MNDYNQPQQDFQQPQVALPNATAVLVLGIIGILTCCCYGGGSLLSIVALVLAAKDLKRYRDNPAMYTPGSLSNLNAGRICAIIGLVFSLMVIAFLVYIISVVGWATLNDPEAMQSFLDQYQ